jgi:hypothetical protein
MPSKSFSYSSVLGFGWRVMTANFGFFLGVGVVIFAVSLLAQIVAQMMALVAPFLFFLVFGALFVIQTIMGIGLIKISLSFCDGQKPGFGTLFNGMDCFWRYLGTGLLYGLILAGVSIVCILPFVLLSVARPNPCFALPVVFAILILTIILAIKFSLSFYFVVDKGFGPISALRASSLATAGVKWSLFFFGILCGLINILGMLCFFVGVFATFPIIMVSMTLVYRLLLEQTPELTKPDSGGTQLEPAVGSTSQRVQLGQGVHFDPGVQPGQVRRAVSVVEHKEQSKGKGDKTFVIGLIVLIVLGSAMAWGIASRLWPKSKSGVGIAPKAAAVSRKKITYSPKEIKLTAILYSEEKSSAIINGKIVKEGDTINGAKVVKIHADGVELERDGVKWTQRAR